MRYWLWPMVLACVVLGAGACQDFEGRYCSQTLQPRLVGAFYEPWTLEGCGEPNYCLVAMSGPGVSFTCKSFDDRPDKPAEWGRGRFNVSDEGAFTCVGDLCAGNYIHATCRRAVGTETLPVDGAGGGTGAGGATNVAGAGGATDVVTVAVYDELRGRLSVNDSGTAVWGNLSRDDGTGCKPVFRRQLAEPDDGE